MQKYANLVDLENPEKMSIWSLSELSIQPRTSLLKFEGDFISSFIRLLKRQLSASNNSKDFCRANDSSALQIGERTGTGVTDLVSPSGSVKAYVL